MSKFYNWFSSNFVKTALSQIPCYNIYNRYGGLFYVSLTVRRGIIPVNNQLDALFQYI
jgi:hypothetical protein